MIGPPAKEAIKPLVALKNDKNPEVRAAVAAALLGIFGGKQDEVKKALGMVELQELLKEMDVGLGQQLKTLRYVLHRFGRPLILKTKD